VITITFYTKFGPEHNKPDEPNLVSWIDFHAVIHGKLFASRILQGDYFVDEGSKLSANTYRPDCNEMNQRKKELMCGIWFLSEGPDPNDLHPPGVEGKPYHIKISMEESGEFYVQHL
jgi:hypothetical protein